ncbi:hypothetical protein AMR72_18145 [Flavobacterium psychrophilum]|nr:hypothetical protein AMR72_18145 [Flavobacterium psychrophilum]AOE54251.1 hypothetical protein ALW18_18130 [Flavobacterium psychrophilum]
MRKITLLLLVVFIFTFGTSYGQWTQNFENGIPSNWEKFTLLNGAPGTVPEWGNSTGTTCQGTTGAYVSNALIGVGNTLQAWLVTPQISIPANADLSFLALQTYPAQNGSIYQLWASTTSQTDTSTFTLVKSWTENEMNPGNQIACYKQTVDLAAFANQNVYLAFVKRDTQYGNAIQGERFTLDDIRIIARCLPATSSIGVATGATTANITINGTPSGTWDINLIPGSTTAPNTGVITHTGTASPIAVTDLLPSTPYTYYVRANCGATQSNWIGPYNFTTFQAAASLPFSDNFESTNVGWSMSTGTQLNKWFVGNAANNGASKSLYVSNNNGAANAYTITQSSIVHAYRDLTIPAGSTNIGISFDWKGLGDGNGNDYFYVWAVPATFNPVAGTGINAATDRIRIADKFYNSANYQPYAYMLNATQFAGQTMRLVFEWRNDALNGVQPPASIDNVSVNVINCNVPSSITYAGITTNGGTINWQETGTATEWNILIQPWGTPFPASTVPGITTTQPTYTATNLNSTSAYDVYVRSVCSSTNKSFWVKAATRLITACGTILPPFTETFNSTSPSKSCWKVVDANGDNLTWNLNTTYLPYEGDQLASLARYWNSTSNNDWLISPAIQLNGNQRVKFRYRVVSASYTTELEVKLSTTGNNVADFTNVLMPQQIINNTVYDQKIIYLNNYTGVAYIALHVPNVTNNSWTLWIDEFVVEDIPGCAAPTALTASNTSNTSGTLSWNAGYQETQWEVKVQPANTGVPTTDGTLVSSSTYNAANLNPATLYEYYVRAYCSSTSKSEWVGPFVFNTTVCPVENRCDYKFTIRATSGNGTFSKLNVYQNGILVGTINAGSGLLNSGNVAMCPGIPFTLNWDYNSWSDYVAEVTVLDSYDEIVYSYVKGVTPVILPITVPVFSGTATCTPVACPKPQNVITTGNTPNAITIDWTEAGSATSWEVFAVSTGEAAPTADSEGEVVTAHPYTLANLTPGRRYSFYVRAICSETSKSSWTLEKVFYSKITNDECSTAYVLPVSTTGYCDTPYRATLLGATASAQANVCGIAAYANDDVWFEFTASSASHILYINNRAGSATTTLNLSKVLYSGSCDNLTQVQCIQGNNVQYNTTFFITGNNINNNDVLLNNLTVGTTYKLRIFSNYAAANDTRFDICIATPATPITIDQTTYTEEQLISDVLVNENCAQVSNLNYSTGTNYGAAHNGIGYFDANGSDFPFQNGIILSTGKAGTAVGPKTTIQSNSYQQTVSPYSILWLGDQDLYNYVSASGTIPGLVNFYNATSIEFDFMAYGTEMSFDFLFASEDYGLFQCNYGDAFAFFLTDEDGNTVNLATLPDTTLPVSVSTTRDNKMNYDVNGSNCTAGNPEFFDKLYDGYKGVSRYAASDNFMGHTVPLKVKSAVVPGATYRIKMVIAETNDGNYDSAIFLDGNSFDVGRINFGDDLLVSTNTAVCYGAQKVLDTKLSNTYFNFVWSKDDVVIDGATAATYTVTEAGTYKVSATVITSGCTTSDEIVIEFNENIATTVNAPADLTLCSSTTEASFNLSLNTTTILEDVANAADFAVSYFETEALAQTGDAADAIADTAAYIAANDNTVYVRVENTVTGCFIIDSFKTIVTPNSAAVLEFSYADDICAIATQNPAPVKATGFAEGGTYSITDTNITIDAATGIIDLTATQPGTYEITYTLADANCLTGGAYEATVIINATAQPAITFSYADTCVLAANATPVLPTEFITGGAYSSATLTVDAQTGEIDLSTATVGAHDISYEVIADAANCTAAATYTATINLTAPTQPAITFSYADTCVLASNATPVLPTGFVTGGTYSSSTLTVDAQTGEIDLSTATAGTHDITYEVVADASNCTAADSYTATITITESIVPVTSFTYEMAYCMGAGVVTPELASGFTSGGVFSSDNQNLVINNADGSIDVSASQPGTYVITYTYTAQQDCEQNASSVFTVTLQDGLEANIKDTCLGNALWLEAVPTNNSYDASSATYVWKNAQGATVGNDSALFNVAEYYNANPNTTFPAVFTVTITSGECSVSKDYEVFNVLCEVQRGISPNGDGKNDNLDLRGMNVDKITIFNRYGTKVYEQRNYTNQWGGQSNSGSDLTTGTYFYILELNNAESKTGWIYINREE